MSAESLRAQAHEIWCTLNEGAPEASELDLRTELRDAGVSESRIEALYPLEVLAPATRIEVLLERQDAATKQAMNDLASRYFTLDNLPASIGHHVFHLYVDGAYAYANSRIAARGNRSLRVVLAFCATLCIRDLREITEDSELHETLHTFFVAIVGRPSLTTTS